jgi:hypothetical protein
LGLPSTSDYTGTAWFIDPQNFELYKVLGPNQYGTEPISLADFTGGLYTIKGGAVWNVEQNKLAIFLDPLNPSTATMDIEGGVSLVRESAIKQLNAPVAAGTRRGVIGDVTMAGPHGPETVAISEPWLTAPGNRVIVLEGSSPGDYGRFRTVSLYDEAGNRIEPDIPPGFRYATGEEVHDRAVASWLMHNAKDEIARMLEADPSAYGGSTIDSDTVARLLATLDINTRAMIGTELAM